MKEKTDELYNEYLKNQLDKIFDVDKSIPRLICINGKYNFVDANGEYLNKTDTWYDKAFDFSEGFAAVQYDGKWNYIDINGNYIGKIWYERASDFSCGRGSVKPDDDMYGFIDKDGKLVKKTWYEEAHDYIDGYAPVLIDDKWNFIDTDGNLLCEKDYDDVFSFRGGFAVVKKGDLYSYIDKTGKNIGPTCWYEDAHDFSDDGIAIVVINGKYRFIDTKGNYINNVEYDDADYFENGRAFVEKNNKYGIIDTNGNLINGKMYRYVKRFDNGYAFVVDDDKCEYNVINIQDGHCMDKWRWYNSEYEPSGNKNFVYYKSRYICVTEDLGNYEVKKVLGGYKCFNGNKSFVVGYKPIKLYGNRYILCLENDSTIYLYDILSKEYEILGDALYVEFDDYLIHCKDYRHSKEDAEPTKHYLMYGNEKFDITDYYNKYIEDDKDNEDEDEDEEEEKITIKPGIELLTKDDFFIKYENSIKAEVDGERQLEADRKEKDKLEREKTQYIETKDKNEEQERNIEAEWKNSINELNRVVQKLEELEKEKGTCLRIHYSNLLIDVGDHKEINPLCFKMGLKHIDLTGETFKNVKLSGIDFRGCNVQFNPQDVYEKDLSNCNFEGIVFGVSTDFTGVNICGTRFSSNGDFKVFDINEVSLFNGIFDENTTFDGIPIVLLIPKEDIEDIEKKRTQ